MLDNLRTRDNFFKPEKIAMFTLLFIFRSLYINNLDLWTSFPKYYYADSWLFWIIVLFRFNLLIERSHNLPLEQTIYGVWGAAVVWVFFNLIAVYDSIWG